MNKIACISVVAVMAILVVTGCTTPTGQGSKTYTRGQAQTQMQIFYGTVLAVADVTIEAQDIGSGSAIGSIVGGILGSTVGGGRGNTLATTGGVLAGAAVGSAAERARARKPGVELEVELDDGRLMVIVQEKDDEYAVGDRIRVVQAGDGSMRVRQ